MPSPAAALRAVLIAIAMFYFAVQLAGSKRHKPSCLSRANHTLQECVHDYNKRMRKDLDDNEQCCALAKQYDCVKDAFEDHCDGEETTDTYGTWRQEFDGNHTEITKACLDYARYTIECIYLNNQAVVICSLVGFVILMIAFLVGMVLVARYKRAKKDRFDVQ